MQALTSPTGGSGAAVTAESPPATRVPLFVGRAALSEGAAGASTAPDAAVATVGALLNQSVTAAATITASRTKLIKGPVRERPSEVAGAGGARSGTAKRVHGRGAESVGAAAA